MARSWLADCDDEGPDAGRLLRVACCEAIDRLLSEASLDVWVAAAAEKGRARVASIK